LVSYEHMGVLKLECVAGCVCGPLLLDSYTASAFSGAETASLNATSFDGPEFVIRATNVARTDGRDGSKVKLLGFYLKTAVSGSQLIKDAEALMYHHETPDDF